MRYVRLALVVGSLAALAGLGGRSSPPCYGAPLEGYFPKVTVSAPTRLDWTFALSNRSLEKPPEGWLPGDYDSTKQQYELYAPRRKDRKTLMPAILFVSAGGSPAGWKSFEKICKAKGIFFASPHNAGNEVPIKKRVRIILDVLDDLRRNYPIDPDRTYIGGISGGGRVACAIGFALPELFGGVIPACASGDVRDESWLRQRVNDRLSVALLTGEKDFNHGEVTRLRGPYLQAVGVKVKVWSQPGLGHTIPGEKVLQEAIAWMESGLAKRQEFAKTYPASRLTAGESPSREEQATALLAEGKARMEKKDYYAGLMQLKGVVERWEDTPAGKEARKILLESQEKPEKPWEADDIAEQRKFLIAQAKALDAYVSGPLPPVYQKQKAAMAKSAAQLYQKILDDGPDTPAGQEAKKRIPEMKKLAGDE